MIDHQYSYYFSVGGGIFLIISGFFDLVDGSVARVTKQTSKRGSFLDSTYDKISESIVYIGIAVGTLASPITCMIAITLSLLSRLCSGAFRITWSSATRNWDR